MKSFKLFFEEMKYWMKDFSLFCDGSDFITPQQAFEDIEKNNPTLIHSYNSDLYSIEKIYELPDNYVRTIGPKLGNRIKISYYKKGNILPNNIPVLTNLSRKDGPAYIDSLSNAWFIDNEYHREDGPARIMKIPRIHTGSNREYDYMPSFYINGDHISYEKYKKYQALKREKESHPYMDKLYDL